MWAGERIGFRFRIRIETSEIDGLKTAFGTIFGVIGAENCETASRVAFLRASILAKEEELHPLLGQIFRRAIFATA